jgi:imidazolonepropionase-like amidohydrolase
MRLAGMILTITMMVFMPLSYGFGATAIRFGQLVDGTGKVTKNAIVVVDGERIKSVTTAAANIPPNSEIIDLSKYTGIPGLINMHTHITGVAGCAACPLPQRTPAEMMFVRGQSDARKAIEMGVTTVRDLGAVGFMDISMRNLINSGDMFGPRMFVSGPGMRPARMFRPPMATPTTHPNQSPEATADSPEEVREVVRRLKAAGVDQIKMFGSTGAGADVSGTQTFTFEEMKAGVETAHELGLKIAIHSYGFTGARDAVLAGVDTLEHGPELDDATIKEMVKRGTFYDPTIDHNMNHFGRQVVAGDPIWTFGENTKKTVRKAIKAGVKFIMGVDGAGDQYVSTEIPYTRNATRELIWYVKAGMTPTQALAAATINPAAALGKEKDLGKVEPGYLADIDAVEGDPLKDVDVTVTKVQWVMKGGKVMVDHTKDSR